MPKQVPKHFSKPVDTVTPPPFVKLEDEEPIEWRKLLASRELLILSIEVYSKARSQLLKIGNHEGAFIFSDLMKRHLEQCCESCLIDRDEYNSIIKSYPELS